MVQFEKTQRDTILAVFHPFNREDSYCGTEQIAKLQDYLSVIDTVILC